MPTLLLTLTAALASPVVFPPGPGERAPLEEDEPPARVELDDPIPPKPAHEDPPLRYELAFRGRYVSVPRGLLSTWLHDANDEGWPVPGQDRPHVHGGTYGLELGIFDRKSSIALLYVEVLHSQMGEGLWDDREHPPDHRDGRWLRPSKFFGAVIIGINGLYDAPIVRPSQTNGAFDMSFQVGGGLGIAALVGRIDSWEVDRDTGKPAWLRLDEDPKRLDLKSPIWALPDVTLGLRFAFVERLVLKLEGGLHGGLFYGGTLGVRL